MLRDARINLIGEGANEVLTSFIALVGMRGPAEELRTVRDALYDPWRRAGTCSAVLPPKRCPDLRRAPRAGAVVGIGPPAHTLGRLIRRFGLEVDRHMLRHREAILDRQLVQEPIARAAMELYASACVLSRRDAELGAGGDDDRAAAWEPSAALLFLRQSARRVREALRRLHDNDNAAVIGVARRIVEGG